MKLFSWTPRFYDPIYYFSSIYLHVTNMYIVVYRGINHNIDELLVGTYTQINLRQQMKIRQQLTADKEYSKDKVIQSE